jgi:NAD(P)-dependent dehydrogenase (short-subunit alcohol dehydrogenase family)/rhamnose utilization protein RhaD (predicted bifunctional aldolase and dehydrogenase)
MNKALLELIKISNAVGRDSTLVQGGGGNTSVKTEDGKYMYIKASGTALKDMDKKRGWRRMRLEPVLAIIKDKSLAKLDAHKREPEVVNRLLLACDDDIDSDKARPSVEAHLHAFLDKCVIHLHPSTAGAFANAKNGKAEIKKLFEKEKIPPLWIPYTDPGFTLAKSISKLVDDYQKRFGKKPAILFMEKHGLLISAGSANTALRLVRQVISRCSSKLKQPKAGMIKTVKQEEINKAKLCIRRTFFEATGQYTAISYFYDDAIAAFMRQKKARKLLSGVITPDELVYANGPAMWVDKCEPKKITKQLKSRMDKGEKHSVAFLVKDVGLFVAGNKKMATTVRDITAYSMFIRTNAARMGGILTLTKRECNFINQWESEAFRMKVAGGQAAGELHGRIAVVTGSGSGLGRSIAVGLAKTGASVALLDIDEKAAKETAEQVPSCQTMVVRCDLTNERDVVNTFQAVLENWGGLDILVNAAGVAPAYPLVDTPVDIWRLALEVNLTGYLLCAREAARIMIAQAMAGCIINLSSKSGLDASKNNTAYNATKAGEIHMARGWALELGEYGIRVNSIAPGNVFEGSKIWNPEYIKVCAEKYGIKPEEVISYYVNKTALKREIKGQDVADSVVFLCSDRAKTITGQVLVPDSGQVMVR